MAEVGEVIENPGTGERLEFVETRSTTGGERLRLELMLAPWGRVGGLPHQHPATETFDVLEGALTAIVGTKRREVQPGEQVVLPAGQGHFLFNETDRPVRARVTSGPAADFETFFETVFAIAHARRYKSFRGLPPPLHAALLSRTYDVYGPGLPIGVQRPILDGLAALARRRGYPERLPPVRIA
jgi:mannose-6-phosphate isomerase-like protein (cupin superfamily)